MLLHKPFTAAIPQSGRCSYSRPVAGSRSCCNSSIRQQLQNTQFHRRSVAAHASQDEGPMGEDLSDIMKQDLERFAQKQPAASRAAEQKQPAPSSPVKEAVDKVLIADFFFILLVLAWLGAGLAEKSALHSSTLIDAWMPLWPMVFQPAIGILMAGALVSGGLNWLAEQQQQKSS